MKVLISSDQDYKYKDAPLLEVEGELNDKPEDVVKTYLELREKLRKGIKEDK